MGQKPGPEDEVTHGICPDCCETFLGAVPLVPLSEFLESLGVPIFLMDDDVRVQAGNQSAASLIGKQLEGLTGKYAGQVIECSYARLPGGCGKTVHCRTCVIRNTVTDTFHTGTSHCRVPAARDLETGDGPRTVRFRISTERVGAGVLLRVDEIAPEGQEGPSRETR
jgi:PAS domain-containing protein